MLPPKASTKAGLVLLATLLYVTALSAEYSFTLDSLSGTAEVQRAGTKGWALVKTGDMLKNNDVLRVMEKSMARLACSDGSVVYVREKSQILINTRHDEETKISSRHLTVFFGALFFVIEKALPKELANHRDTKVFTPTSVVAVRGTAFSVEVDPESGESVVEVLNGTVEVRSIGENARSFVGAAHTTSVAKGAKQVVPKPLFEEDVDQLRVWVPPEVIDREISEQLAKARSERTAISGKGRQKLVIVPFTDRSSYKEATTEAKWDISTKLAWLVGQRLRRENRWLEVTVQHTDGSKPLEVGAQQEADFVISGVINSFEIVPHAQISTQADTYREFLIARIKATVKLTDAGKGEELYAGTFTGEVSGKNRPQNTWKHIGTLALDMNQDEFAETILGQAINQALDKSAETLSRHLHY